MKFSCTIIGLLVLGTACAADLGTITFTNSAKRVISNAVVTKITATDVIYTTDGGGGSFPLAKLPPDLQQRFNYNPVKASEAAEKKRLADEAYAEWARKRNANQARVEAEGRMKFAVEQSKIHIAGVVLQVHPNGLRVRGIAPVNAQPGINNTVNYVKAGGYFEGECLLVNHANFRNIADGDTVDVVAYPDGTDTYGTKGGTSRTLKKFSVRPPIAQ